MLKILIKHGVLSIKKLSLLLLNFDKLIKQKLNITNISKMIVLILPIFID